MLNACIRIRGNLVNMNKIYVGFRREVARHCCCDDDCASRPEQTDKRRFQNKFAFSQGR
jgi:hypothetical protein